MAVCSRSSSAAVELGRAGVGREHGGVQDLVGERPADPGDRALVAQEPVQQVGMLLGGAGEHVDRERRVERLGADVGEFLFQRLR